MIILGIDPGTARMGYAVVEVTGKKNLKLHKTDVLITHPDLEPEKRLKFLYDELVRIIKEYSPHVMVIEQLFFNTNAKTAIAVGQARGICMLAAAKNKVKVHNHTALEAKLSLTGYGRADKKEMQAGVMKLLKLPTIIKSDDANDAVAMALCYVAKEINGERRSKEKKK